MLPMGRGPAGRPGIDGNGVAEMRMGRRVVRKAAGRVDQLRFLGWRAGGRGRGNG